MNFILNAANDAIAQVLLSLLHNWPYLLLSILIASALKIYVDQEKVSAFLRRNSHTGVLAATTAAVATPFCSCGTTAIILGMMAGMMPWAPIIAFMVASPLTSPEELFYSAGIFGWPFALTFFVASIVLGLAGGMIGSILDRGGWLRNQARMAAVGTSSEKPAVPAFSDCGCETRVLPLQLATVSACGCDMSEVGLPVLAAPSACGCGVSEAQFPVAAAPVRGNAVPAVTFQDKAKVRAQDLLAEAATTGKQLLKMYLGFAFIGYFLNGLIPTEWVSGLFGGHSFGVPLAATLGLPLYISTEASLPLIRALIDAGMSQGAAMAFMISGAGTSFGAVAGALTIARWRVIAVVVGVLWIGAITFGYLYNALLALSWM